MYTTLLRYGRQHLPHVLAFGVFMTLPTLFVLAADCNDGTQFCSVVQGDLMTLLVNILNGVIFILFPIIVLMVVYTGFLFVAAQGNEAKLTAARRALMFTLIGALVVLGSKALAILICNTVNDLGGNAACPS